MINIDNKLLFLIILLIGVTYLVLIYPHPHVICKFPRENYQEKQLITNELFKNNKINAYCISLERKPENLKFIKNEWKNYLNIIHFKALNSCTNSHKKLLTNIWDERNNNSFFPIVIMEDDVYKMNNFNKYWNNINDIKNNHNVDYITFDCIFLKFNENQDVTHPNFVKLDEHRATGLIVYFQQFFLKFDTKDKLTEYIGDPIDMNLTHNKNIIKWTPNRQICRQKVNKYSETINENTDYYEEYYNLAKNKLENFK